jgi:excinuclease ABC subunit B
LAVVDDPTAKQRVVQGKAGAYAGMKKYGDAANLPTGSLKKRGGGSSPSPLRGGSTAKGGRGGGTREDSSSSASRAHKPHLDEMHGPESLPYRPGRASSRKPSSEDTPPDSGSRIFQPTSSREAALGRSTGGAPGHRGGWKKR